VRRARLVVALLAAALFALGVVAGEARPAGSDQATISLLVTASNKPALDVLIPNFERVYPNVAVNVTYTPSFTVQTQVEMTELAAGNAPDLLYVTPGCGTTLSVCVLAKAGYLAPLINKPWTRWSLPLVISFSKYGQGLFTFLTTLGPQEVFTDDALFRKLGLKVPQTFPQLLALCRQAKADGTVALVLDGASQSSLAADIFDLAATTVYAKDKHWLAELKAGTATFDGSPGWHQALQELVDMNNAGCFQPGASGTSGTSAIAQFAQGQGLMIELSAGQNGLIDAAGPQFSYSSFPFPDATAPDRTWTVVSMGTGIGVNAHASPLNQAAAQTFIDFIARPKQDALNAKIKGTLTQYELAHQQLQPYMSSFKPIFANHQYVISPGQTFWNPNVLDVLHQDAVGLLTGQSTVEGILNAMDDAWKQGPA
jgi:raffinose/stachyose/melibiose transport system substrate-binding protein